MPFLFSDEEYVKLFVMDKERLDNLTTLRRQRVSLVDELEGDVDDLVEGLVNLEVFTRDDREVVLCLPGPRARVRKVLDILECKGEEAAQIFFSVRRQPLKEEKTLHHQSKDFVKLKQKHKDVLRRRSESMLHYNTRHGEKKLFSEHYVNLLLVDGHQGLENKRHEVLTFGQKRLIWEQKSSALRKINSAELFSNVNEKRSVKKVLVTGVAGIGKTILVQKILCDFGRNENHLTFDFVIHMTFRDLNLIDKPTKLRELILRKNGHLAKEVDNILENDDKLLIVLDGFDEFKHYRSSDLDVFVTEPDEEAEVQEIIGSLMLGELLPNACVLLTSRPTAVNHIPVGCIDRFVLIAGFSLNEVQDYFLRYFQDKDLSDQLFNVVVANKLMLTLCYIPAFCNIVCCILKESNCLQKENPKTMTDIYVQYLVALLQSHTKARTETCPQGHKANSMHEMSDIVLKLGQLAFQRLLEHQTLFYGSDLDMAALEGYSVVSTFLDKTIVQEQGYTEEVFSFSHLTVQEFFAALFCAMTDHPLPNELQNTGSEEETNSGHLQLFSRFLSGILSERNTNILSRQAGLCCNIEKANSYRNKILSDLTRLCENGANILNSLHCLFEQQDPSLALEVQPTVLRINVSDETLSQMDYNAVKYFLNLKEGNLLEMDLTGTDVGCDALRDLQPLLLRCEKLWIGENTLTMDTVQVIADVLQKSDLLTHIGLGWSNLSDGEIFALSSAIRVKKKLQELWIEGNHVTSRGLLELSDLSPYPLEKVVAIWNDLTDVDPTSFDNVGRITVNFTNDSMWELWGDWVFRRCTVSSNEKLVMVLQKVCNLSAQCLEVEWTKTFYTKLCQLIKTRIECCTEEAMCKRLKKFEDILNL
ncbi:NACHT, LRR and PYD domains-containing protein 3-like [Gouania willdenowi]|uniref:NACHT, LRR and PYD domains-containing protein 3-like n=2 Tax=Gouania willdenowi TaxID=441366 RepID=A0A8C5I6E5_GOUWI|nr:NACHT, LRR and PYD domains-containing protein 3-like [Gouania willdenowi]